MATKSDFTPEEWSALEKGIMAAGTFVALSDRKLLDSFKEAGALAKHLSAAHQTSESSLVRELATSHSKPFGLTSSPAEVSKGTVESLQAAVAALKAKSPEDLDAYRALVVDVAESVAKAAHGVSPSESDALDVIRGALGDTPDAAGSEP
jgi:hypothetical protein